MDFTHYTGEPADLAVALVNTDQRPIGGEDEISDIASLKEFLEGYKEQWGDVAYQPKRDELAAIHEIRNTLRDVINSEDETEASQRLNTLLANNVATPRVSVHNGHPHLHFEPQGSTMTSWLGVVTAMGLATVLIEHGLERFGSCQSSTCEDVYVDTSRNRSRRHCSTQCSSREAVVAYRKRQQD